MGSTAPTRIALLALVAAGTLAAGTGANGSAAPSSHASARAIAVAAVHGRKSIRLRDAPTLRQSHGPPQEIFNQLGRMPAAIDKQAKTALTPSLPASPLLPGPKLASQSGLNIDGLDSSLTGGYFPPDTNGDVGPNDFVQTTNQAWAVFDKTGQVLGGAFANNVLWSKVAQPDPCYVAPEGDPTIVYDRIADRWVLSYFAWGTDINGLPTDPFYQCIAVSTSGDPLGLWWLYDFDITNITKIPDGATAGFPDYPKMAVWPDGYYMSANLFWPEGSPSYELSMGVAFERSQMLGGGVARSRGFVETDTSNSIGRMLPANYEGGGAPAQGVADPFVAPDPDSYELHLYQFDGNWSGDVVGPTMRTIPILAYRPPVCADASGYCIAQPGTSVKLPAIDDGQLMYRAAYRKFSDHESLVVNQTVDKASPPAAATNIAGVHWYELRGVTGASPSDTAEGVFSPDGVYRWAAAAAIDKAGNIGLGYNVSDGSSVKPGIRYAGRTAGAGAGAFDVTEATLQNGSGVVTGPFPTGVSQRWGDYSSLSVDPVDGCTFWFTGEYLGADTTYAGWNTRIGTFLIPSGSCGSTNRQPTASFTATPNPVDPNTDVTFNGSASSDPDAGDSIASYQWDFDGDGTFDATGATPAADQYALPGTYTALLKVTDTHGASNTTSRTITVNTPGGFHPSNDPRSTPLALAANDKDQVTNQAATLEGGEVHACNSRSYDKTIWLSFHAPEAGTLDIKTGTTLDTVMALYKGSDSTPLTCNDDDAQAAPGPSHISRRVTAGDYMIQVGGLGSGAGANSGSFPVADTFTANAAPTADFSVSPSPPAAGIPITFDGSGSHDSDGSIAKYEWDLDGDGTFETNSGTNATTTKTYSGPTDLTVKLRVTDNEGTSTVVSKAISVAKASPPTAKMTVSPNPVLVGKTVTFDGSGSPDAFHAITKYEWDLDGDGVYEKDTGTTPTTTATYPKAGTYAVGLRVTDGQGSTGTTTVPLKVNTLTGPALFGVTINNGATYTRTPDVVVSATFPSFTTQMLFSNDGGFLAPMTFPAQKDTKWTLVSTGPERLPKVVYVKFSANGILSDNFTDDIILDEIPPVVATASVSPAGATTARAVHAAKLKTWKVKVKATDSNSGVGGVQVTANKKKPGKLYKYARKLKVKSATRPKWVRARDKAGNLSKWKKAR